MQLTTVVEDDRMVPRLAPIEQRVFQYCRVARPLSFATLVAAPVLLSAGLRRLQGIHGRWRGRRPGIIEERLRLYVNKVHYVTSDWTSEIGKKKASHEGTIIASTSLTLHMHNPARTAYEVRCQWVHALELRGRLVHG